VAADPQIQVALGAGVVARLRLASDATVIGAGDESVFSFDLAGRPYALVHEGLTWRRALDGRFLVKGRQSASGGRLRERLEASHGEAVLRPARAAVSGLAAALRNRHDRAEPASAAAALERLETIAGMDETALAQDVVRYRSTYAGGVGILPPDEYLSLVVQLTEGCSWNACTFCDFYRGRRFHVKSSAELDAHLAAVKAFFGPAVALRRRLFLGDANALCVASGRLLPLLETVTRAFPVAPVGLDARGRRDWAASRPDGMQSMASFVDAFTGSRIEVAEYREYARLGLGRVYVGVESGDPGLLRWLDKPGSPDQAAAMVEALHQAGIEAGVIVLLGAGGEAFFESHGDLTAELLRRLRLSSRDSIYISELTGTADLPYAQRAARDDVRALSADRLEEQRWRILAGLSEAPARDRPRVVSYDIREFVY